MKTLIVFSSKHGCIEKCVQKLKDGISGEPNIVNLKQKMKTDINLYDLILIGGSIHSGRLQKSIHRFCNENLQTLQKKNIGLFMCCMEKGKKAQEQFDNNYPEVLRDHALATGIFGGEFNFDKMNLVEKIIVKKVAGIKESVSRISDEIIQNFISTINEKMEEE